VKRLPAVLTVCGLLLLLLGPAAWASPLESYPTIHIVRWGENLTGIARRYGTTVQAIMSANSIGNPNRIYAGQRLMIPGAAPPPVPSGGFRYTVKYGDSISGISYRFGVSISALVHVNNLVNPNRIYAGQRLWIPGHAPIPAPVPGGSCYVVRPGDTLAKIAVRFGTTVWAMVQANNIPNPNVIHVGQCLQIPKAVTPTPAPVKPGCEHLQWPREGVSLAGIVQVKGTAKLNNFWYYKLEFRYDGLDEWHYITGAETAVDNGLLGEWNTKQVADGRYFFRLVVVDRTGNYPPPCEIVVTVHNDP